MPIGAASCGRAGAEDAAKPRSVAWTFLPFIERKCHKGRFDQILCRTQSGRRNETCANNYANTVIAYNFWRFQGCRSPLLPINTLFGVAIGSGMVPPSRSHRPTTPQHDSSADLGHG